LVKDGHKKYIKFKELRDTNGNPCYQIRNNKDEFLGDLYLEKRKWIFYPVEGDLREPIFWTIECLEELVNFIKKHKL